MMFVDASALVAILLGEADGDALLARIVYADGKLCTSAIAVFEAALAITRVLGTDMETAAAAVEAFLLRRDIAIVPIEAATATAALEAFNRYGKGRHPARLNMGNCFAYAVAKQRGVVLLYKGDDFALTDLA